MSVHFWQSALGRREHPGALQHAISCLSPSARHVMERSAGGITLASVDPGACEERCVVVQLRVGVSVDAANRVLPTRWAPRWSDGARALPRARGAALEMQQLASDGLPRRPLWFDWWLRRCASLLPLSLIVVGGGTHLGVPEDGFGGRVLSITADSVAALAQLAEAPPLSSVEVVRFHGCLGRRGEALAAFPSIRVFAMHGGRTGPPAGIDVGALAGHPHLHTVVLVGCQLAFPPIAAGDFARLRALHLEGCTGTWEWEALTGLPQLSYLHWDVAGAGEPSSRAPPLNLPGLQQLVACGSRAADFGTLSRCSALARLQLRQWAAELLDFAAIGQAAASLVDVTISDSTTLSEVLLDGCVGLVRLTLRQCRRLVRVAVADCASLEVLRIDCCPSLTAVTGLGRAPQLRSLSVHQSPQLENMDVSQNARIHKVYVEPCGTALAEGVAALHDTLRQLYLSTAGIAALQLSVYRRLTELVLWRCQGLASLSGLGGSAALTQLAVYDCHQLSHLDVSGCGALEGVELRGCPQLPAVSGVGELVALRAFTARDCAAVTSIDLSASRSLTVLRCTQCASLRSVEGLRGHKRLEAITLVDCPRLAQLDVRDCPTLRSIETQSSGTLAVIA